MSFKVTFSSSREFEVHFGSDSNLKAEFSPYIEVPVADYYSGPYEVTPSENTQLIDCGGLVALRDIVVNPIPSNWGKITWNGSVLTVS